MVDKGFTSQPSQIDAVVLLDRRVDLITPLVTPLTYEGLVDELFGINYTVTQLPADRFPEDEGKGRCLFVCLFVIQNTVFPRIVVGEIIDSSLLRGYNVFSLARI